MNNNTQKMLSLQWRRMPFGFTERYLNVFLYPPSHFQRVRVCLSHYWLLCSLQYFRGVWTSLQFPAPAHVLFLPPLLPHCASLGHSHSGVAWQSLHYTCRETRHGIKIRWYSCVKHWNSRKVFALHNFSFTFSVSVFGGGLWAEIQSEWI